MVDRDVRDRLPVEQGRVNRGYPEQVNEGSQFVVDRQHRSAGARDDRVRSQDRGQVLVGLGDVVAVIEVMVASDAEAVGHGR